MQSEVLLKMLIYLRISEQQLKKFPSLFLQVCNIFMGLIDNRLQLLKAGWDVWGQDEQDVSMQ